MVNTMNDGHKFYYDTVKNYVVEQQYRKREDSILFSIQNAASETRFGTPFYRPTVFVIDGLMREGKTNKIVNSYIPHLLNNTDAKIAILAAPRLSILEQKHSLIHSMASDNGFIVLDMNNFKPKDVLFYLKNNKKMVITMTTQKASSQSNKRMNEFYDFCSSNDVKIGFFFDEFHWGSFDSVEGLELASGKKDKKYQASLYSLIENMVKHTPYVFATTATMNFQQLGLIDVFGNTRFEPVFRSRMNPLVMNGSLGWLANSGIHFFSHHTSLYSHQTIDEAFVSMVNQCHQRNQECKTKICAMVKASRETKKATKSKSYWKNVHEVIDALVSMDHSSISNDKSEQLFAVLTSNEKYLVDQEGNRTHTTADEIRERMNNPSDPLRFLSLIDMDFIGVTYPYVKMLFDSSSRSDKKRSPKTFTYNDDAICQAWGRTLTSNLDGLPYDEFLSEYDGNIGNIPNFNGKANMIDLYLYETDVNLEALVRFRNDYAPDAPELQQVEVCSECAGSGICQHCDGTGVFHIGEAEGPTATEQLDFSSMSFDFI